MRRDPTPPVAHALVAQDLDPAANPPPQAAQAVPLAERQRMRWWLVLIAVAAAWAVFTVLRHVGQRRRPDAQTMHRRRGIELVELARSLGVKVEAKDTAAVICARITGRTGFDLAPQLAAYEAARFGDGPPAPPWPPCR